MWSTPARRRTSNRRAPTEEHPTVLALRRLDVEGLHVQGSAGGLDRLRGLVGVVGGDVRRPVARHLRHRLPTDAGDRAAVLGRDPVTLRVLGGGLRADGPCHSLPFTAWSSRWLLPSMRTTPRKAAIRARRSAGTAASAVVSACNNASASEVEMPACASIAGSFSVSPAHSTTLQASPVRCKQRAPAQLRLRPVRDRECAGDHDRIHGQGRLRLVPVPHHDGANVGRGRR